MPKISVLMSVYNGEKWLEEAIESILGQSFEDFEFIIIDDGSKDRSSEIIRSFSDARIVFLQQKNAGLAAALKRGVELARSELVARMDADDISLPNRLQTQYDFLQQNPQIVALGSGAIYVDEQGQEITQVYMPETHAQVLKWLPESPIIHPSVMFRKSFYFQVGGYFSELSYTEDAVLFNRMAKVGQLHNLPIPLLKYRVVKSSMSKIPESQRFLLNEIVMRVAASGKVSESDRLALDKMRFQASEAQKIFSYHFFIAKLYLRRGNFCAARKHLRMASRSGDKMGILYPAVAVSLLPEALVRFIWWIFEKYKEIRNKIFLIENV